MSNLDKKLDDVIARSFSVWRADKNQTEQDAPNRVNWFRPNNGELWFFAFDHDMVKQAFIDDGWLSPELKKQLPELKKYMEWSDDHHVATCEAVLRAETAWNDYYKDHMTKEEWERQTVCVGSDPLLIDPNYTEEQLRAISKAWSEPRMTGKEWYGKFMEELPKDVIIKYDCHQNVSFHAGNNHGLRVARDAARKATGIEESERG